MKHPDIVAKMTLAQKAKIVSGKDYWHMEGFEELGLPVIQMTDGPHGLRKQNPDDKTVGLGGSYPATCFPPASLSGCSWDPALLEQEGAAMGEECLQEKVSVILGPGTNIKRAPTCGRNFEYFSEDPYLAGKCSAAIIRGIQSKGVGTSLKHFALNSQEAYRMVINEVADERTLREIYLPAFEIAVKEAQPWTIMSAYNRVNGIYASENKWLLDTVARKEWGFEGIFVTDWGASVDRIPGLKAGTDLEMPTSGDMNDKLIIKAVESGKLDEAVLDERVDALVDLILKSKPALEEAHSYDIEEHHQIAARIAEGSMQLLKNDGDLLPLKAGQKVAVIGEMAVKPRYQGAGSSVINPTKIDNALDNLKALGVDVTYAQGYRKEADKLENDLFCEALNAAKQADVVVVFAGLTEPFEGEGYDRKNINIPACQNRLIAEICKLNPNVAVVLAGGSVIKMPWHSKVKAILNSGLGGQAGGIAVANILTGKVNPSGKTTETYIKDYKDNPTYGNYPSTAQTAEHRESVYIGYRYYDKAGKNVLFPFGHGLSYTKFKYTAIKLSSTSIKDSDEVTVSFKVKNTGDVAGAEIAQVYVADKESTIFRPEKELKAFAKVFLEPGEQKEVKLVLDKRAFAFYNVAIHDWCVESGEFDILVGASSRDIRLKAALKVKADAVEIPDYSATAPNYYDNICAITREDFEVLYGKKLPSPERSKNKRIDKYCCLDDAKHTKWGGRICALIHKAVGAVGGSDANGDAAMIAAMATQIPMRNFVAMSMGAFTPQMLNGLLKLLNDEESSVQGIAKILAGIPVLVTKIPDLLKAI
ncbi:MAG: glycoside hydrolase family 3 C-terminal domain-containing protein [Clostridia bacterium]|nr:glycoside hydrolase family 3 C-terminal domain-containing protein [Clostridia bacterium]